MFFLIGLLILKPTKRSLKILLYILKARNSLIINRVLSPIDNLKQICYYILEFGEIGV